MGKHRKMIWLVMQVLLLLTTGLLLLSAEPSRTWPSPRSLLRDAAGGSNDASHPRVLLTIRYAPIGFPPPPMTSPPPPGSY